MHLAASLKVATSFTAAITIAAVSYSGSVSVSVAVAHGPLHVVLDMDEVCVNVWASESVLQPHVMLKSNTATVSVSI